MYYYNMLPFYQCSLPKGIEREDYLKFLISNGVATFEEQKEYISIVRPNVENYWNNYKLEVEKQLNEVISENEKIAIKLRAVGQYEFAVKREEYIELIKSTKNKEPFINFRGFSLGWGSEFI